MTGILTEETKRVVLEQRLGYHATVCPDGTPNLSPKGTASVWDDDHRFFAEIRSLEYYLGVSRRSRGAESH